MTAVTVRNLPEETHRALKLRAKRHGRSTEAEIRDILTNAVRDKGPRKLGTELVELGKLVGGFDVEIERDRTPIEPASFD